jgi:hypothetical protein
LCGVVWRRDPDDVAWSTLAEGDRDDTPLSKLAGADTGRT